MSAFPIGNLAPLVGRVMERPRWWVHNLVAHPLLVLCPPVGLWLHERTQPA